MGMLRLSGLYTLIPTTILLTISFFVLCLLRKLEHRGLRNFGYVIAALLWICSALVFAAGIYVMATGRHPMMNMMMQMKGSRMPHPMMQGPRMGTGMQQPQPLNK